MKRHTSISLEQKAYFSNTCEKSGILLSDAAMDEDEMLKKAIAMSLEEETGVSLAKRQNKAEPNKFQVARRQRRCL